MRTVLKSVGGLAVIMVCAPLLLAEDVCILDPISVTDLQGRVYFEVDGKREALPDVTVEVAPYGYKKPPIATSVTKQDGTFVMRQLRLGRYYLSVRHSVVIGLSVEVRLKKAKRPKGAPTLIEIVLRNDPSKYCAGATAKAMREASGGPTDLPKKP